MRYYRYSRWDGTQQIAPFDPEELLEQLSDDLLADGDLRSGLQRLMQMGHRNPAGDRMMGLQQLLERLRQQRQQQLNRFQLNDVMKDIQEKLDEVLRTRKPRPGSLGLLGAFGPGFGAELALTEFA